MSAALRAKAPIIPCSIVGSEEIYPMIGDVTVLARLFGLPYFPITPLFPLAGPVGMIPLPSKWHIEFGEPIPTADYDESAPEDPMVTFELTDQVRELEPLRPRLDSAINETVRWRNEAVRHHADTIAVQGELTRLQHHVASAAARLANAHRAALPGRAPGRQCVATALCR